MHSPEFPTGIEPIGQGQTQDIAGASGSQTPMASLEVPTHTVYMYHLWQNLIPPPAELAAYPTPPPPGPIVYLAPAELAAPAPPVPTVYPTPASAVQVAPFSVPPPTVPPAAATHIDTVVPPVVYASAYAAVPGVPPPIYLAVLPVPPAPGIPPVLTMIPTHLTNIVAA
ncbi:protein TRACHEARY ELEMENT DIFFERENTIATION-RELATED 7A-like [Zingiber officinale]|uniref:protein TRACHEARY ELEMENT DIFFERENTIATION-RELATED 7A-like n=1 Tax=Zingiber officinale TaxID=94328 RepID=UPI001C4D645C|nr:protein TRACHEARY ELEMENT DIFFERENTIATION-RELATED 7A-like [Zingiber officinale]